MGAGIAYVTAQAGIDVVLIDRDQESGRQGQGLFAQADGPTRSSSGRAKQADADALLARITRDADYDAAQGRATS